MSSLRRAVSERLVANGYEKSGRTHLKHFRPQWAFVVDTGPLGARRDISPWVGLRLDPLEDLRAELEELPRDRYVATVGANVGYLLGDSFRTWEHPDDLDAVMSEVERATGILGEYADLDRLAGAFSLRGTGGARVYQSVPRQLLAGKAAEAKDLLVAATEQECRVPGPVCDHFRLFERNVRRHIEDRRC